MKCSEQNRVCGWFYTGRIESSDSSTRDLRAHAMEGPQRVFATYSKGVSNSLKIYLHFACVRAQFVKSIKFHVNVFGQCNCS
jgi:hypothetical protein